MLIVFKGEQGASGQLEDDSWDDETTAVIPSRDLALLCEVMHSPDDRPTERFLPVPDETLADGSSTEMPQTYVCEEVVAFPRAAVRSVTVAPAADAHPRAWLIAIALVLLAIQVAALAS